MSQDKFWLQFNNGKTEQLNDAKHGIRKEQVDKKYHNLFDGYDTNNNGTLEENELETVKEHFKTFAGDSTLNQDENLKAQSVFADKVQMKDVDFMGFIKSVSDASLEITSSKEKYTRDGGKEITTYYKNGTIETIAYYKNGDFKWKKVTEKFEKTTYEMVINGQKKELTEEEYKKALEEAGKIENKGKTQANTPRTYSDIGTQTPEIAPSNVINISSNTETKEEYKEFYSPRFIAETIGIDIHSEDGIKIIERLSLIPPNSLMSLKDGKEINEVLTQNDLPPSFDNISNILELLYGITLRDEKEYEASKEQREKLIAQIQAVEIMSELYATVAQYNDDYSDSQGLFGMGSEGIGWILNKLGLDGENHYQWANSCREFIEKINNFKVLNPETFNEEFKELTGKMEFDINALQKMVELAKEGKAQDAEGNYTEEYKEAVKAFSDFDISNPNAKAWYHPDNLISGFGEALIMIGTLGWGAETQGGKMLAMSTIGSFSRLGVTVASLPARNKLIQGALRLSGKGVKLIGPALNEGTKMYLYTAITGTATNIANRGIKFDSEENTLKKLLATEEMVLDGATGSFEFGAFAGIFGSTITQKVMQSASKVSSKVGTALADKFAKGSVEASDAYITILEKSIPTKFAETVGFVTDVLGFTGFETAIGLYHAHNNKEKYPNGISIEDFTNILWEEFKGQGVNLGQIKGVSYLVMFITGSKSARMQASQYMRENIPQLKGSKIDKIENRYRINLPDGRKIECKNEKEMISSLHLMVRCETAFSKKFAVNPEQVTEQSVPESTGGNPKLNSNFATESDLEAIHKIDLENFEGRGYNISENFSEYKADLESHCIETHVLKSQEGKVLGYYQLEPVVGDELYIYSIGVSKELQNTRSSYEALKTMQEEIAALAREKRLNKVSLDVESDNPRLVKLYKKFGFEEKGKNADGDIHMEADVKKVLNIKPEEVEPTETESVVSSDIPKPEEPTTKEAKSDESETKTAPQEKKRLPFVFGYGQVTGTIIETLKTKTKRTANPESDLDFINSNLDKSNYSYQSDDSKSHRGNILTVDDKPYGYIFYIKPKNKYAKENSTELFIHIDENATPDIKEAILQHLNEQQYPEIVRNNNLKEITTKVNPENKATIEFLESNGFVRTGIEEGYFADGSSAYVYKLADAKLNRFNSYLKESGNDNIFLDEEHRAVVSDRCKQEDFSSNYDEILDLYINAKNKDLFTQENVEKIQELAKKYGQNPKTIFRDRIQVLSAIESIDELEQIFKLRTQLKNRKGELLETEDYSMEATQAQLELLKHKDEFTEVLDSRYIDGVLKHLKNKSQLEGILYILKQTYLTDLLSHEEYAQVNLKFCHLMFDIKSKSDAEHRISIVTRMLDKTGYCEKNLEEFLSEVNYSYHHRDSEQIDEIMGRILSKFENIPLHYKNMVSLLRQIAHSENVEQYERTINALAESDSGGLNAFKNMFLSDNVPYEEMFSNSLKIFEELSKFKMSAVRSDKLTEAVWRYAQGETENYLQTLRDLKSNPNIPDNLKLYCLFANKDNPESVYDILKKYPQEKVNQFAETGLIRFLGLNMELLNSDVNFDIVKKYNLADYTTFLNDKVIAAINGLKESKLAKIKEHGLFERVTEISDIEKLSLIEDEAFSKIKERSILQLKTQTGLTPHEIRRAANLSDEQWQKFKNIPDNVELNNKLLLATLNDNQYNDIQNLIAYLKDNKNLLQQADMSKLTDEQITGLLMNNNKLAGTIAVVKIAGVEVLKHATELRFKGYEEFLNSTSHLEKLPDDITELLKTKLDALPHPEQKIDKLMAISGLVEGQVNLEKIKDIIEHIDSPQVTEDQVDIINKIFTSSKSYDEQIEDFITEFKVPEKNRGKIRNFLRENKLNERLTELPSIEKQLEVLNKKLAAVENNNNIPSDKKARLIQNLKAQIKDLEEHPEKYSGKRVNDTAMKLFAPQIEAHINLPNQQADFSARLNKTLYEILKIETTPELLTDVQYESKYFARLLSASATSTEFQKQFIKVIELIKQNPGKNWIDIIQELPQNIETRKMFEELGLNYKRWETFDENSKLGFTYKIDVEEAVRGAAENLADEFDSELAKRLDKNEIEKLKAILKDRDIKTAGQTRLPKIMRAVMQEIKSNDYWKQDSPDIKEFLDHMEIQRRNIKEVSELQEVSEELYVRLWDKNNIGRNIFFGNHVGCCTSVSHSNQFAAPQHLMNSFVNGIELVDKRGVSQGNSMCYFARIDGQLTFVIDSFEANGKLGRVPEVTNAIINYAKQVCREMGVPDANIMFGPNFNKIDLSRCVKTTGHTIEVIGRVPDMTYIDCVGGRNTINHKVSGRPMHEIIDLEADTNKPNLPHATTSEYELVEQARMENPASVAERKVFQEWVKDGLSEKPQPPLLDAQHSNPVSELIFSGKLGETLTKRYEKANEVYSEILNKHKDEIQSLLDKYPGDNQKFAQGVLNILCKEFGLKATVPQIRLFENEKAGGQCNWHRGTIDLSIDIADTNKLVEILTHEFTHFLQFRDVLAQYGELGLIELIANNNHYTPEEKAYYIQKVLDCPLNQKLLENVQNQKAENGSLNYYLRKIYKDEKTNIKSSDNKEEYTGQLIEREAFYLGRNGSEIDLSIKVKDLDELSNEEAEKFIKDNNAVVSGEGFVFSIGPDGRIDFIGTKKPKTPDKNARIPEGIIVDGEKQQTEESFDFDKDNSVKTVTSPQSKIPAERIQHLLEKANGNQNIIKNLQKLINAGANYSLCSDIVHRLDVPEDIVDIFIQKFQETEGSISYQMFTFINHLQDSSGLKSNYKEILDYTLGLFEKTSNGKKLTASQVGDLIGYSRNDKATIDLMLEYMNIDELGNNQLKPIDIADLLPYIQENPQQAKERIARIAKLTPEQLESRDNNALDGKTVKQILEIENLTDEQLDLIKSVLCDKTLQKISLGDYYRVNCAKEFDFDKNLIDLFKNLISADLHPNGYFDKQALHYSGVCFIVKNFPNKEDISTIKTLFEHKAFLQDGRRLKEEDFMLGKISQEDIAKMRAYVEAIKDNDDLMNHLSFEIIRDKKRVEKILQMLNTDPNITYDKIIMEIDILPKVKHIENKELQELALEAGKRKLSTYTRDLIQEISYKIDGIEDEHLNNAINTLLKETTDYLKKGSNQCDHTLPLIDEWLDAYHTLKGDYEYIGTKMDPTFKRAFYTFVKENEPERAAELDRAIQEGKFDSDNPVWERIMHDFAQEAGIDRLRNYMKNHPHDDMGEYLYKKYYLPTLPTELQEKCNDILTFFNTNIFLTHTEDTDFARLALDYTAAEFFEWKEKSNGTAIFPPVLDFSKAKRSYIDDISAYGKGTTAAFAENETNNSISIDGYERAMNTLRHEMTHLNDTKKGRPIDIQYDINEIMPKVTDENGNEQIDFENCKYREEFLKAGIPVETIKYAYTNIEEFIAVASEGDMTKYSEEFKKVLINFGMPEWILNLKVQHPQTISNAAKVSYIIEFANHFDLQVDGQNIDISKNFQVLTELLNELNRCEDVCEVVSKEFRKYNVPYSPTKLFEYCIDREDKEEILSDLDRVKDILLDREQSKHDVLRTEKIKSFEEISKDVEKWSKIWNELNSGKTKQESEEKQTAEKLPNYREKRKSYDLNENFDLYMERNLPMSQEDFENSIKIITDERLKTIAERAFQEEQLGESLFDYISDINEGLKFINDEKILNYINEKLQKMLNNNYDESIDNEIKYFENLGDIAQIVDVFNTMNGNYSRYKKVTQMMNNIYLDDKPITAEWIEHLRSTDPDGYEELLWEISNNELGFQSADFMSGQKTESLASITANKELLDYMYQNYYLDKIEDTEIKTQLADISKTYGVRILLSAQTNDLNKTLLSIKGELEAWQAQSDGKAVLPPILDLNYCDIEYNKYHAAAYVTSDGNIGHQGGLTINIMRFLRHEIMHLNDPNLRINSTKDKEFLDLVNSIMPSKIVKKDGKNVKVLDYDNCKYREELLRIGITPEHIKYAYTNLKEFLAVCAEGDLSRCTPEFKELLKKLGMPEFVFDLPLTNPDTKANIRSYDIVTDHNPSIKDFNGLTKLINRHNHRGSKLEQQLLDFIFGNASLDELEASESDIFRNEKPIKDILQNINLSEKISSLTGTEALETLLKIKEETDKIYEKLIQDHENFGKENHSIDEFRDEHYKFYEIKYAYEKYKIAVDTAVDLAQRIKYEESQSKVEKNFTVYKKSEAENLIESALSSVHLQDWFSSYLIKACTIEDMVSEELVNRCIEMIAKDSSDLYKIEGFIKLFKTKSGIDRAAIEIYDELSAGEYKGKDGSIVRILEACKDEDKKFRFDRYEKVKEMLTGDNCDPQYVKHVFTSCEKYHHTPDYMHTYEYIDEDLWAKALELKEMGFRTYEIHKLMFFCRSDINSTDYFSQERFELIKELKDKYNISLDNISTILERCVNDGKFDRKQYDASISLVGHVKNEDIESFSDILAKADNRDVAIEHIDELQQKYDVESRRVGFLYKDCCDKIKDSDGNTTYRFNQTKYEKAIELKSKYNVDDFDTQKYLQTCTVKGQFVEQIYNKIIEYKDKYDFDDDMLSRLIRECIHPEEGESSWDASDIDYRLIDKIGVWTDLYLKSADETAKNNQTVPDHNFYKIGQDIANILEKIESIDCEATDYIEKCIEAGMTNISARLNNAYVLDENGFRTNPAHYNPVILQTMIDWVNKYHLEHEQFEQVMWRVAHQKNLTREEAMEYITQLYEAGWNPKNTNAFRAIIEHWGQDNNVEFNIDAINLFTEYLKQGYTTSVIEQAIFSCAKNGEPHTDEYYELDREKFSTLLEMVKYVPEDKQFDAAGWMKYFTDWSESIIDVLKNKKVNINEYYNFVRMELCAVGVIDNTEKIGQIPLILEQIRLHPESFEDIKEIFLDKNFPHNDKYFTFCFNHLENQDWKRCFEINTRSMCYSYYGAQRLINILSLIDTDKVPCYEEWGNNNLARYADNICTNIFRSKEGKYCTEVIEKIKELMISGELDNLILGTGGSTIVFDNPEFCNVLDALAKAEREGLDKDLVQSAFYKIRGGNDVRDNYFAPNYQEIIDFYVRNKEALGNTKSFGVSENLNKKIQISELIDKIDTNDIELLEKTIYYAQKFDNPSLLKTVSNLIFRNNVNPIAENIDIKPLIEFFNKVDFEKYGREINTLLSQMVTEQRWHYDNKFKARNLLLSENLSKENLEIILDTEHFLNEKFGVPKLSEDGYLEMPSENRPELDNHFFQLFMDGNIPDEALNKLRFYLEYQASMTNENDIPFEVVGTGEVHGTSKIELYDIVRIVSIYKLRPDKIEFFEKYLFSVDEEYEHLMQYVIRELSQDKNILDKQIELLEDILSYDNSNNSRYRIQEVFSSSKAIYIDDQIEIWEQLKPKNKNPKKGELSDVLCVISYVTDYNKIVIANAVKQKRFKDFRDLGSLLDCTKATNQELIVDLINDEKYSSKFIIQIAGYTYQPHSVEFARLLLKDGTFTQDQILNILNGTRINLVPLSKELCFNKNINFPKDKIFDVLWSCTNDNEQLAWKLCTSRVRQIPEDKIPLAMRCYHNREINMDMFINKFKMFLDLEFSDDFIKSILGTSGSLARYTKNFCTVLQHLQEKGAKAQDCVEILTANIISDNLTQNINTLEILNSLDGEDIRLLQADGIDIYDKIQRLQKAIDVKHPIIDIQKGDEIQTLKILANNSQADEVIKNMDLTQFEGKNGKPAGIPLQYTREEFMKNMNHLITEYTSGESDKLNGLASIENKNIPQLELSEEAQEKVKQKIEEFKQEYGYKQSDEDIIMDGKTCHGIRFTGSKTSGSNPGDFYLIDDKLYYVKTPTSDKLGQSIEEVIASRLYRAAEIDAPNEHYIFNKQGEVIGMASEYVPDMQAKDWGHATEEEAKLMFESFAVDAWLADWDAPKNDNTQIYEGGKIIKSDVGGSMHYRARGEIKENFNGIVIELLTLIENNSILYSKMTKQDVLNSIKRVLDIPDATIYQTIMQSPSRDSKLAETMIRRKAYLQKFYENFEKLDDNGQNVVDLIIEAQGLTVTEFKEIPDIAGTFGYIATENGFEGLLNTQSSDKVLLTPEQQAIADKIKDEIERFTVHNRLADSAEVPEEVRTFINGILKGIPEFASYFGKPQHGNGSIDSDGKYSGHQYSLDVHILNVLQKSVNNPLYEKVDEYGFKLLDDESKLVLKFSALLHDIGKMYLNGKDAGHAERSAEYVYSILNRFNLPKRVKNRIINMVNNHHWFEKLCTGATDEKEIAATFRTTADFTIARIMAQADLESVHEGYFTSRMSRNFPSEVSNEKSAYKKFNAMMDNIQQKVSQIEETSAVVTPSKFVEVPEHIGSDGKVVPRRGFPIVEIELDGKVEQFRILNLNDLNPNTDMYQYGFNHIKLKDMKLLVHRFGDGEWGKFTTTKLLGDNPSRYSVQSLSLISPKHAAAYCGRNFSCIMEGNNANIGVAFYRNAGTGTWKNLSNLIEEIFQQHYEKKRIFFKQEFLNFMKENAGIELSDKEYGAIMRYVRNKQYIETQLKDLNLGGKKIKRDDLVNALLHSQQRLIDKQKKDHEEHNEETEIDCNVIAGGASLKTIEELKEKTEFLRLCRDNCNGNIILW